LKELINLNIQFAAQDGLSEQSSSGGISSLGLNAKSFLFQLITFVIVLLILRKWVFPKLVATLEERRKVLEQSLEQARETEETLRKTEASTAEILSKARDQADAALSDAQNHAKEIISQAEKSGETAAARIVKEAESHLSKERAKLRDEIKEELADLVVTTTEKVIGKRLSTQEDMNLIKSSIKELER
jgi:F-type H+-transporting ATPase subunit b